MTTLTSFAPFALPPNLCEIILKKGVKLFEKKYIPFLSHVGVNTPQLSVQFLEAATSSRHQVFPET